MFNHRSASENHQRAKIITAGEDEVDVETTKSAVRPPLEASYV